MNNSYYDRLINLFTVMLWHHQAMLQDAVVPTRLNGEVRYFNMNTWDCGTSACAYGSYAQSKLVDHNHFVFRNFGHSITGIYTVEDKMGSITTYESAANHFNISLDESCWLFEPIRYMPDTDEYGEPLWGTGPVADTDHIEPIHVLDRILCVIQRYYPDHEHPMLPPEIHTTDFERVSRPVAESST